MPLDRHVEIEGDRILWRILVNDTVALDVLTTATTLARAHSILRNARGRDSVEEPLGTFGPFLITMSSTSEERRIALALDGPELGSAFSGNQAVVVYVDRNDVLAALQIT